MHQHRSIGGGALMHLVLSPEGLWARTTRSLIEAGRTSINPLQLLVYATVIVLLDRTARMPNHKQISFRGDYYTACNVANAGIAYRPAIRFALGVFLDVCYVARAQ